MIPEQTREVLNYIQWQRVDQQLLWGEQHYHPRTWMGMLRAACEDFDAPNEDPASYALVLIEVAAVAVAAVEDMLQTLPEDERIAFRVEMSTWSQQISRRWQEAQDES